MQARHAPNRYQPAAIGNDAGTAQLCGCLRHSGARSTHHLRDDVVSQWKAFGPRPLGRQEQPAREPLDGTMKAAADCRLTELVYQEL